MFTLYRIGFCSVSKAAPVQCKPESEEFPLWTEALSVIQSATFLFDLKRSFTSTRFRCNFCSDKSVQAWLGPFQRIHVWQCFTFCHFQLRAMGRLSVVMQSIWLLVGEALASPSSEHRMSNFAALKTDATRQLARATQYNEDDKVEKISTFSGWWSKTIIIHLKFLNITFSSSVVISCLFFIQGIWLVFKFWLPRIVQNPESNY